METLPSNSPSSLPVIRLAAHVDNLRRLVTYMLFNAPVHDIIFACLPIIDMIHLGATCFTARAALKGFMRRAYNIHRFLSRFFSDPLTFRYLQRATGTLISGSSAVQFLERTFYPDSDLDLYTHSCHTVDVGRWLIIGEGYVFKPTLTQPSDFFAPRAPLFPWRRPFPRTDIEWNSMDSEGYQSNSIDDVFYFERRRGDKLVDRIQIVSAKNNPFQCIMSFHSTCVMNVITSDTAYSLYPYATFVLYHALSFASSSPRDRAAIAKYTTRGWSFTSNRLPMDYNQAYRWFGINKRRRFIDSRTWSVPLTPVADTKSLPPLKLAPTAQCLLWDPVLPNNWCLARRMDSMGWKMVPTYVVMKPSIFKYSYLAADHGRIEACLQFFRDQGVIEHAKVADTEDSENGDDESKALVWKWWDYVAPFLLSNRQASTPLI